MTLDFNLALVLEKLARRLVIFIHIMFLKEKGKTKRNPFQMLMP